MKIDRSAIVDKPHILGKRFVLWREEYAVMFEGSPLDTVVFFLGRVPPSVLGFFIIFTITWLLAYLLFGLFSGSFLGGCRLFSLGFRLASGGASRGLHLFTNGQVGIRIFLFNSIRLAFSVDTVGWPLPALRTGQGYIIIRLILNGLLRGRLLGFRLARTNSLCFFLGILLDSLLLGRELGV